MGELLYIAAIALGEQRRLFLSLSLHRFAT